jgi:hypothetical protein
MVHSQVMSILATRSCTSAPTLKAYSGCGHTLAITDLTEAMIKAGDQVVREEMGRIEPVLKAGAGVAEPGSLPTAARVLRERRRSRGRG